MAQKVRKKAEAKVKEEAERKKIAEKKKKKKKRMLEYLQQLWDKVLVEETTLLKSIKRSQVIGSKYKEVTSKDKKGQQPSKKAREKQQEKYHRDATVKIGGANPCERYVSTRQDCLVYHSRQVVNSYYYYYYF